MTGTNEKTEMQPPPAPNIKLKRMSVNGGDRTVDSKHVTEDVTEEGSNSAEVSSTTASANLDAEVSSTLSYGYESMDLYIRPPSPSIIEVPVPPKPPPEFIDLEDEESDDSTEILHEQELETSDKYDEAFPDPRHRIVHRKVELVCAAIIERYYKATGSLQSTHGSTPQRVITINFYKHLHQNQSKLDVHVSRLAKDETDPDVAWSCWSGRSKLSSHIGTYLGHTIISSSAGAASHPIEPLAVNWNEVLPVLRHGKTQLQQILRESFSTTSPNTTEVWHDKWSPLNLTMPFELFMHCVTRRIQTAKPGHERHRRRLLWKWYIEYMGIVAESNQEFVLAVVSIFGTCIWRYAGRILELFQLRDMLKIACRLPGSNFASTHARDDDSIISRRNELLVNVLMSEIGDQSSTDGANILASKYQLTLKEFSNVATKSLMSFHGPTYTVSTQEISHWYKNLEQSDTFVVLLQQALQVLMTENKRFASYSGVKQITCSENYEFKKGLGSELEKRMRKSGVFVVHQLTLQMTMELELSYLQLSLSPNVAIPPPKRWSPVNSLFPYVAFCRIVHLQLAQNGEKFQLCTDALRVRYVQLMSAYYATNSKQILLAVFGAMGRNFDNYPLPILHILQHRGLIRSNLGLPLCVASNTTTLFKSLDQSYGLKKRKQTSTTSATSQAQSAASAPKRSAVSAPNVALQQPNPTPSVFSSNLRHLNSLNHKPASGSNGHQIPLLVQTVSIDDTPVSRPRNNITAETENLMGWKAATEKALENFHLPPLSSTGAQDTFDRHTEYYGTQASYRNPQFVQGMLAGISVAIKSWEEQKKFTAKKSTSAAPASDVISGEPISVLPPNLSQRPSYQYPTTAQPVQHVVPQSTGQQYLPTQLTQNHLPQGTSYSYALVQIPMHAGLHQIPVYNHKNGIFPPHFAQSVSYSDSQTMSQLPSCIWGGAQPPQPRTSPVQPPLPPGPAP